MTVMVREFVEIGSQANLEFLVGKLNDLLAELPQGAHDAVVRPCGDDAFGRYLQLTYLRPQTPAEAQIYARYGNVG